MGVIQGISLSNFNRLIADDLAKDPRLRSVWVTAETADVRVSGGHCYLELIEKDGQGRPLARLRATIWANVYRQIYSKFLYATGQEFRSDLKVMVCLTANFHPVFGLSANISDIDPSYTLGDAMRRRAEMIEQLKKEGIINDNKNLPWPTLVQRIAIVSANGAAGYGDFVNQLFNNQARLRFSAKLFPAVMQGESAAKSVTSALDRIAAEAHLWDCVVIIRGGGATSDLACFDDLELARCIANFSLPVVIGIGHERDITLLDYVANMRVKTPTAAAEWLVGRGLEALGRLQQLGAAMLQIVTDRISGCHRQLAFITGQLPALAETCVSRAQKRLIASQAGISAIADRLIKPEQARIQAIGAALKQAAAVALSRQRQRLDASQQLLTVLSPEATLRRGYTITRIGGHAATSAADIHPGEVIETIFVDGTVLSTALTSEQVNE